MAKLTSGFGVLLAVVGVMGYLWIDAVAPFWFGVVLIVCGVMADTADRRRRMICMHAAVVVGLLAFLLPSFEAFRNVVRARRVGGGIELPIQQRFDEVVALLCLMYVLTCVGSFIVARRGGTTAIEAGA